MFNTVSQIGFNMIKWLAFTSYPFISEKGNKVAHASRKVIYQCVATSSASATNIQPRKYIATFISSLIKHDVNSTRRN